MSVVEQHVINPIHCFRYGIVFLLHCLGRKKIIKVRKFGDPLQLDDNDSDDEDYVPEFNIEMEKKKNLNGWEIWILKKFLLVNG